MWSPFWSVLACKIPQFWAKATDSDEPSYFLEIRHFEVTKTPYYVLSPEWSQKSVTAHGLSGIVSLINLCNDRDIKKDAMFLDSMTKII